MSDQAKTFCAQGAGLIGGASYAREPIEPTPEEMAEWRRQEKEQREAYEDRQRQEHRKQLRDAFAMAALTGLLASGSVGSPERFSITAYEYADAMLKARGDD